MTIKTLTSLVFLIAAGQVSAQNIAAIMDLKTQSANKVNRTEAGITVSFIKSLDSVYNLSNTVRYGAVSVDYWNRPGFEKSTLKSIENKFRFSAAWLNKTKFTIEFTPMAAFETQLDHSDIYLLGGFETDYELNKKSKITIGVKRTAIFGKLQWLPVFAFQSQLTTKTAINIGFPESNITYSGNPRNRFGLANSFNGNFYRLDNTLNASDYSSFSQMTTSLNYDRTIDENWSLNLKGGYDFDRNNSLLDNNFKKTYDFNIKNGCNFSIAIKYKL